MFCGERNVHLTGNLFSFVCVEECVSFDTIRNAMKFLETIGVVYRSGAGNNHASSSLCDTSSSSSHSSPLPSSSVATGELNHFNSSAFHSSPSMRTLLPSYQNATPQSGHNNPLPVVSHGPSQLIIVPMQQLDRLGRIVQTLDQFRCKSMLTAS